MLTIKPIPLPGGTFGFSRADLDAAGLTSSGRRFLSPSDAVAWLLTAPWCPTR